MQCSRVRRRKIRKISNKWICLAIEMSRPLFRINQSKNPLYQKKKKQNKNKKKKPGRLSRRGALKSCVSLTTNNINEQVLPVKQLRWSANVKKYTAPAMSSPIGVNNMTRTTPIPSTKLPCACFQCKNVRKCKKNK